MKSYSTSNSHTPALYRQLPKKSFRLIQLLPGSWNDPLDTELLGPFVYLRPVISIRQSFPLLMAKPLTMLPYSTLGGNRQTPRKTTVNGLIQWITTNLDLPLRTLRAGQREETV